MLNRIHKIFILLLFTSLSACEDASISTGSLPGNQPNPAVFDWTIQQTETEENLTDVFFVDMKIGWVVGDNNTLLSTTSGGLNWPQAPVSLQEGNFRGVHLINSNEGWISGDLNGKNENGNIYLSTSGGSYPEPQRLMSYPINTVFSIEEDYVWAAGDSGQLIYSVDAGKNWIKTETFLDIDITDIFFLYNDLGFASGNKGKIIKSLDGGKTWQNEFEYPESDLMAIHYVNAENGWACGTGNTILKYYYIEDSASWISSEIENELAGMTWNDIYFLNENKGWIVGEGGTVYRSDDGGQTWIRESTGLFDDLTAIHMVHENKGWIVGENGLILTYTPKN